MFKKLQTPASIPSADFHSTLSTTWPLPHALANIQFVSCHFDSTRLPYDAFDRYAIAETDSMRWSVAKRRAEFLAGRICARKALSLSSLDVAAPATNIDRSPRWATDVVGSITHTHNWAAAVVARKSNWRAIGIDAEPWLPAEQVSVLAPDILTTNELSRLPPRDAHRQLTATFSLKESLFKALYPSVGQYFSLQQAEITQCSFAAGHARLRLLSDLSTQWTCGTEIDAQFGVYQDLFISLVAIRNV